MKEVEFISKNQSKLILTGNEARTISLCNRYSTRKSYPKTQVQANLIFIQLYLEPLEPYRLTDAGVCIVARKGSSGEK